MLGRFSHATPTVFALTFVALHEFVVVNLILLDPCSTIRALPEVGLATYFTVHTFLLILAFLSQHLLELLDHLVLALSEKVFHLSIGETRIPTEAFEFLVFMDIWARIIIVSLSKDALLNALNATETLVATFKLNAITKTLLLITVSAIEGRHVSAFREDTELTEVIVLFD